MAASADLPTPDPLLAREAGTTAFLLGNEAIVRGAIEAGISYACGYPGTPSSEITDTFSRLAKPLGIGFEYSVNEKIALEMAFAASLAGARSIVAMKHLGLMYAGDPLTTIPYIGTKSGLVIVSAGDPSCLTSPNEQDQRQIAPMLHIPMLDPSTPQEALEMTRFAFELSEEAELPVILRPTTRLCHSRAELRFGARQDAEIHGFERNPKRYVPIPGNARNLRIEIDTRLHKARERIHESGFCYARGKSRKAILCSGVPAAVVAELLAEFECEDKVKLLHAGAVYPFPKKWLVEELSEVEELLVIEELLPYLEDAVHALCSRKGMKVQIYGKRSGHLPSHFEYGPERIQGAMHETLGICPAPEDAGDEIPTAPRPPILCPSCPHRSAFFAARSGLSEEDLFFNDIGCYTLGYGPPLRSADALLSMGSSFSLASGVAKVSGKRTVAFMGDATFFHSGMPALLNAIKEDHDLIAVIMDNQVTAMTGFQESPAVQISEGRVKRQVDIEAVIRALGAKSVQTVDPNDLATSIEAFHRAGEEKGLSVLITRRPCSTYARKLGIESDSLEGVETYRIDPARCRHCGREELGHRCSQETTLGFEKQMARARSLETHEDDGPVEVAPCASACPLLLCIQGYSAHIAAGRYADALELILDGLPLPNAVCRVCHRPCEDVCVRSAQDGAVSINDLKRFVVEWAESQDVDPYAPQLDEAHGHSVAIVGAGPSGLAAAHSLRVRGYDVDLYDAKSEPGGLLRYGIPEYRLPREVLGRDVQRILKLGVRFHGDKRLGKDISLSSLRESSDAVLLSCGLGKGRSLTLDGEGPELLDAVSWLEKRKEESSERIAGRVLVIGGGNAAIDAARTALRLGASRVEILALESREELPAISSEIEEAEQEGVLVHTRTRLAALSKDGAELVSVERKGDGPFDPSQCIDVEGSSRSTGCSLVLVAIGQEAGRARLDELQLSEEQGPGAAEEENGIYLAGDLAGETQSVTDAIASGLRAAHRIDTALRGSAEADRRPAPSAVDDRRHESRPGARRRDHVSRHEAPDLCRESGRRTFDEVHGTLSEEDARKEAERCMICGRCGNCRSCLDLFGCPAFVLEHGAITIDEQLCVACGVCAQFCPNGAILPVLETVERV